MAIHILFSVEVIIHVSGDLFNFFRDSTLSKAKTNKIKIVNIQHGMRMTYLSFLNS